MVSRLNLGSSKVFPESIRSQGENHYCLLETRRIENPILSWDILQRDSFRKFGSSSFYLHKQTLFISTMVEAVVLTLLQFKSILYEDCSLYSISTFSLRFRHAFSGFQFLMLMDCRVDLQISKLILLSHTRKWS